MADAQRFIEVDGTYQGYDAMPAGGDELTEADIRAANRMIARMGPADAQALLSRRDQIRDALIAIPASASLADPSVPWRELKSLYVAVDGLRGIGLARATKVLHKKRPALIPILDEVVARYLAGVDGAVSGSLAVRGVALTRSYHRELHHVLPALTHVRSELDRRGFYLTECRLLDIYLWAYSSTYEPLWQRRLQTRSAPDPLSRARHQDHSAVRLPTGVERFVNDDDGYRHWLAAHPDGYVLNCNHRPQPSYLKLHRTSCRHMNRPDVTNWTGSYAKVCSADVALLDQWAISEVDTQPDRCPVCHP